MRSPYHCRNKNWPQFHPFKDSQIYLDLWLNSPAKIRGGPPSTRKGPWTMSIGWSINLGYMFCIRPHMWGEGVKFRSLIFWQNYFVCWLPGGGVLPYKRLTGMCRWVGSHFHDWIDNNGVAFSIELLEWCRKFSDFWGKTVRHIYG